MSDGKIADKVRNNSLFKIECIKTESCIIKMAPSCMHIHNKRWRICHELLVEYGDGVKIAIYWSFENTAKKMKLKHINVVYYSKKMKPPYQDVNKKTNALAKKENIYEIFYYLKCIVHTAINSSCTIKSVEKWEGDNNNRKNIAAATGVFIPSCLTFIFRFGKFSYFTLCLALWSKTRKMMQFINFYWTLTELNK